jgi:CheY-like chemotaxis protein
MHRPSLLLLLLASLLAWSPASAGDAKPARLRLVHYYAGALQETLDRLVQGFNASQSKLVVQVEFVPFGDLKRNLMVANASGDLPDVAILDNPDTAAQVRTLLETILRRAGYRVIVASGGAEALAAWERSPTPFQLLLTDVVMPGMSGRVLADELRKLQPDLKVLYVSGYTDQAIVHHGVLDPGTHFIPKPITPEALTRKVREVLDPQAR